MSSDGDVTNEELSNELLCMTNKKEWWRRVPHVTAEEMKRDHFKWMGMTEQQQKIENAKLCAAVGDEMEKMFERRHRITYVSPTERERALAVERRVRQIMDPPVYSAFPRGHTPFVNKPSGE